MYLNSTPITTCSHILSTMILFHGEFCNVLLNAQCTYMYMYCMYVHVYVQCTCMHCTCVCGQTFVMFSFQSCCSFLPLLYLDLQWAQQLVHQGSGEESGREGEGEREGRERESEGEKGKEREGKREGDGQKRESNREKEKETER